MGVRGHDSLGFSGWLVGCCVYVAGPGWGCWLCVSVCIHIPRWDVCGIWVRALGCVGNATKVYVITLQYVMCAAWEMCGMVSCDVSVTCAMCEFVCTILSVINN